MTLKSFEDVSRFIKERGIQMVDLKFCNLFGGWHHITLPAYHATPAVLEEGVGFDSSSTPGYKELEAGDMCLLPDLSTGFEDPFWDKPTLSFICNIAEADTRTLFYRDPRVIARKAEDYLKATGIADLSLWGPEFEFYVFDAVFHQDSSNWSAYRIEAREAVWDTYPDNPPSPPFSKGGKGGITPPLGHSIRHQGGYHAIPPLDKYYNLRSEVTQLLHEAGVEVHYHHHEVGGPSQSEIEVVLGPLTRMGDSALMIKYFVKMTAHRNGLSATFMPKPLYGEAGSGMHFHQHLFKEIIPLNPPLRKGEKGGSAGKGEKGEPPFSKGGQGGLQPVFYDAKGYAGLSKTALSYIAGILHHGRALLALTNPSTNSYKRLVPGYEAPVNLFFSLANRSAAIRVPKYTRSPESKRMEFRPPDATCNPYLAMAAMLLAGIDGVKKKMDPTKMGFGPYDQNLFSPQHAGLREKIKTVPASMKEAFEALQEDHDFLLQGDVFRKDIIQTWIDYKLSREFMEVRNRPHPYEIALYYNC